MDTEQPKLSTHQKALKINLDPVRYGTFAEIGAGQEVARWFFPGGRGGRLHFQIHFRLRYGGQRRHLRPVQALRLARTAAEHAGPRAQPQPRTPASARAATRTAFFVFADTVSARNYQGTNECHGWMGVKYQAHPRDDDSQILIHVRMLDHENGLQQEALGIVGVNLLYARLFPASQAGADARVAAGQPEHGPDRDRHGRVFRHRVPPRG